MGLAGLSAGRDPSLRLHFHSFGSGCSKTHGIGPVHCLLLFLHSVRPMARCHFSPGRGLSWILWLRSLQKPVDAWGWGNEPWG